MPGKNAVLKAQRLNSAGGPVEAVSINITAHKDLVFLRVVDSKLNITSFAITRPDWDAMVKKTT